MRIVVPEIPLEPLKQALQVAPAEERKLMHAQTRLLELCHGINGTQASVEHLGWLSLWSRCWQLSTIARATEPAPVSSRILFRTSIELYLHSELTLSPVLQRDSMETKEKSVVRSIETKEGQDLVRMRVLGYTTWCLLEDERNLKDVLRNLGDVFDGSSVTKLRADPAALMLHESLFGEVEFENQHVLDGDRTAAEQTIHERLNFVQKELQRPSVREWSDRFKRQRRSAGKWPTLWDALGENQKSIRERLGAIGVGFLYPLYSESSMVIHGTSIGQWVEVGDIEVRPHVGIAAESESALMDAVADNCLRSAYNLYFIRRCLWPDLTAKP